MSSNQVGSARQRVVVIEDDEDVRLLLEQHLRRLGWSVHGAATGEAGLAVVSDVLPDVVVVDLGLPGIGGADVVAALRAEPLTSGCAVVVTSVLDRSEQLLVRPDAVLAKPFSRGEVARVMSSVSGAVLPADTPATGSQP